MFNQTLLMKDLIEYASKTNPVWPFATLILDEKGNELIRSTDCAHISPLYHAESLAIHVLCEKLKRRNLSNLTLITTAEPDPLSMSAIYWAGVVNEIKIDKVYYGMSLEDLKELWPFGISIKAKEIIDRSTNPNIQIEGPILKDEVNNLFQEAKKIQKQINDKHPGFVTLSKNVDDFFISSCAPTGA